MLTGMTGPTSGTATVYGQDILTEMENIRKGIGVCPQHNILWMPLTVEEHLKIFAKLRGIPEPEIQPTIAQLLQDVGLTEKVFTTAEELSGGQKRKLSLCLALIGDVSTVVLDEPTSGMDPYSRRSTWNILQDARPGRTMILTTHFMDEADMLGDRIAILAEGRLRCCGSSLFLKNRFGSGYHLVVSRSIGATVPAERILDVVHMAVPDARILTDVGAEASIQLPSTAVANFPKLFELMDNSKAELQVDNYGLSQATLEEIFLKIASNEDLGESETVEVPAPTSALAEETISDMAEGTVIWRHYTAMVVKRMNYGRRDLKGLACVGLVPVALLIGGLSLLKFGGRIHQPALTMSTSQFQEIPVPVPFNASIYTPTVAHHATDMLGTGQHVLRIPKQAEYTNVTGQIFGVNYQGGVPCDIQCPSQDSPVCPVITGGFQVAKQAGVTITCATTEATCKTSFKSACANDAAECVRACMNAPNSPGNQQVCQQGCDQACSQMGKIVPELCGAISHNKTIGELCKSYCGTCPINSKDTTCQPQGSDAVDAEALLGFMLDLFQDGMWSTFGNVTYGGVLFPVPTTYSGVTSSIIINTTARHAVPVYTNLANDALKKAASGGASSITTSSFPFPLGGFFENVVNSTLALASTLFIMIAFSFIPASIVGYIVKEREPEHDSKHQQMISGASVPAFWLANYTWDLFTYAIPCGLSILAIDLFKIGVFNTTQAFDVCILLFIGYGLAIIPFTYRECSSPRPPLPPLTRLARCGQCSRSCSSRTRRR